MPHFSNVRLAPRLAQALRGRLTDGPLAREHRGGRPLDAFLEDVRHEFRRHKAMADRAIATLDDRQFFGSPSRQVNPVALIVKHLAGNLTSRWTDFLTT